ncbi:transmembrane protein 241-like isoform X1 [Dreissena polymorpha]|uniref:transmembrane protein 241-like isoform X1 n=1 Tax=Dreissena polymorpha TaxID=45954 RepID=UPI002264E10E|nr:transmembrane protein 241-like isoform X1 [Dreissena polymorpha]
MGNFNSKQGFSRCAYFAFQNHVKLTFFGDGTMQPLIQHSTIYCLLFVATHFVNKYVLSVLEFQFPTIFQGWQTLVGFLMLSLLGASGHLPSLMVTATRQDIASWLPGMMLFVASIYSCSKALATLSMPVFLSLHNLINVIVCIGQVVLFRQMTSVYSYIMLMTVLMSSVLLALNDPDFHSGGYYWMCVYVFTSGGIALFSKYARGRVKLSAHEKLYCNYLYSVIVLAPSSYFLGDAVKAGEYPYLFYSKFYIGCIMSGLFGVFLSLCNIKLLELDVDQVKISHICGLSKLATSVLSLGFFRINVTANSLLFICINQLAAIVCEDCSKLEQPQEHPLPLHLTQQTLNTRDFIKTM